VFFLKGTEYSVRKNRVGLDFIYQELTGSSKIRGLYDGRKKKKNVIYCYFSLKIICIIENN